MSDESWTNKNEDQILENIQAAIDVLKDPQPMRLAVTNRTYVELFLAGLNFGWWPLRIFRRQGARKALLAYLDRE